MPVPRKRALDLALSLENATSYPHFDRVAVRTPRRTFATFAVRGDDVNFAFDLALQEHFCALAPHAIAPVEGGWGRMGWTRCDLNSVDLATFKAALLAAHARSNAPPPRRPRARAAVTPRDAEREGSTSRGRKGTSSVSRPRSEKGATGLKKRTARSVGSLPAASIGRAESPVTGSASTVKQRASNGKTARRVRTKSRGQ